ncbi:sensor histidine kinase [Kineococcus sp. SYSU DK003]|uniref:sensor histidine kinase n=1 Tax=Kineococcus sp. SYSU DK003 TaxID=3383124 RepID=UPI003D7DE467
MSNVQQPAGGRPWLAPWRSGWWALCHGTTSLLLLGPYLLVVLLVVLGTALTPVLLTGVPLLVAGRFLARLAGGLERRRYRTLLDVEIQAPGDPVPGRGWWRTLLGDVVMWRTVAHLALVCTVGALVGTLALGLVSAGTGAIFAPVLVESVSGVAGAGVHWPFGIPGTIPLPDGAVAAAGALLVVGVVRFAPYLLECEAGPARSLLRPPRTTEAALRRRVETLTTTRERAVDSVEAERRRIERDLHDGPQQRLVAVALQLGMARRALEKDPQADVSGFLAAAQGNAREAITDMRSVARGIVPPVLTDRGLDAALSGLAAAAPLPVSVEVRLSTRPVPAAEAIAYFCVSEALTNVAKHARASSARVQVWRDGTQLRARISDDGIGGAGADGSGGSGLTGLADRLGAVDGWLRVDSPPGGPTDVSVGLPGFDGREG